MKSEVNYIECEHCGCLCDESDIICHDDMYYCVDCYDEIPTCDVCGRVQSSDYRLTCTDDNYNLCERCFERHVTSCEVCGCVYYHEYNACECCESERNVFEHDRGVIRSYGHTNAIEMHKEHDEDYSSLFFGVELEFSGYQTDDVFREVTPLLEEYCSYFKEDSSLCDTENDVFGAEVALQPGTYKWFERDGFSVSKVINKMNRAGFYASSELCGLHIHVNRTYFTNRNISELLYKAKLRTLVGNLSEELQELSGRADFYWCSFSDVINQVQKIKNEKGVDKKICKAIELSTENKTSRYYAINFSNNNTIEFRFFAGTDDYNEILSRLRIINDICEFVASHDILECINVNSIEEMREKLCV